jgi:hypothetical protein
MYKKKMFYYLFDMLELGPYLSGGLLINAKTWKYANFVYLIMNTLDLNHYYHVSI